MAATGQNKYAADGQYTGATMSEEGKDGVVCEEQGKDACEGGKGKDAKAKTADKAEPKVKTEAEKKAEAAECQKQIKAKCAGEDKAATAAKAKEAACAKANKDTCKADDKAVTDANAKAAQCKKSNPGKKDACKVDDKAAADAKTTADACKTKSGDTCKVDVLAAAEASTKADTCKTDACKAAKPAAAATSKQGEGWLANKKTYKTKIARPTQYSSNLKTQTPEIFKKHVQDYDTCNHYADFKQIEVIPKIRDGTNRQARLHTCFESCKDYVYDDYKDVYFIDTRPNCTDLADSDERYLLCLHTDEQCEKTMHDDEVVMSSSFSFNPRVGLVALIIATPIQFLFELFCIYLVKVKVNTDKASETNKLLIYQVLVTLIFALLQALFLKDIYNVFTFGRPSYVMTTFFGIWLFDNLKSIFTLALVHCIVVRRFMHLEVNEN